MDNIEFEIPKYKVYIKTDKSNRVKEINSSAFVDDTTDWIEIDEGVGEKYAYAYKLYFDKPLIDFEEYTHNYIYEDDKVRETTDEEKEEEKESFPKPQPSPIEVLNEEVVALEEAMCDNYAEQAETNATVEEALIEIYELIEGGI